MVDDSNNNIVYLPSSFICAISKCIMTVPVRLNGMSTVYELSALKKALKLNPGVDPHTKCVVEDQAILLEDKLQTEIEVYLRDHAFFLAGRTVCHLDTCLGRLDVGFVNKESDRLNSYLIWMNHIIRNGEDKLCDVVGVNFPVFIQAIMASAEIREDLLEDEIKHLESLLESSSKMLRFGTNTFTDSPETIDLELRISVDVNHKSDSDYSNKSKETVDSIPLLDSKVLDLISEKSFVATFLLDDFNNKTTNESEVTNIEDSLKNDYKYDFPMLTTNNHKQEAKSEEDINSNVSGEISTKEPPQDTAKKHDIPSSTSDKSMDTRSNTKPSSLKKSTSIKSNKNMQNGSKQAVNKTSSSSSSGSSYEHTLNWMRNPRTFRAQDPSLVFCVSDYSIVGPPPPFRPLTWGSDASFSFTMENSTLMKKHISEVMDKNTSLHTRSPLEIMTPLHAAAKGGHVGVLEALLNSGADTEVKNGMNCTCLRIAVRYGHVDCVKYLLERGASMLDVTRSDICLLNRTDETEVRKNMLNLINDARIKAGLPRLSKH